LAFSSDSLWAIFNASCFPSSLALANSVFASVLALVSTALAETSALVSSFLASSFTSTVFFALSLASSFFCTFLDSLWTLFTIEVELKLKCKKNYVILQLDPLRLFSAFFVAKYDLIKIKVFLTSRTLNKIIKNHEHDT
jgi:hypothetical protein